LASVGYEVVLIAPTEQPKTCCGVRIAAVDMPTNRRQRMTRTVQQVYRAAVAERADLYHFHDPELIPVGLALKARGAKVVYDVHEDVPKQKRAELWIPRGTRWLVGHAAGCLEMLAARVLDGIVAATPQIARRFPPAKTVVVRNCPILDEFTNVGRIPHSQRKCKALYVGLIAPQRGATNMIDAIAQLPDHLGAELVMGGTFSSPTLRTELGQRSGWQRVCYEGWCSRDKVAQLTSEARLGLVTLLPTAAYREALATKLLEYMAAGLPVVASDFPGWRWIVQKADCGLLVDPTRSSAIAQAMYWLFTHPDEAEAMGRRGRLAVTQEFDWRMEADKLLACYERIIGPLTGSNRTARRAAGTTELPQAA